MKLFVILLAILSFTLYVKSTPSKYIYSQTYSTTDTQCTGDVASMEYNVDGLCQYGAQTQCSEDNKSVLIKYYDTLNCTGTTFDSITIQAGTCIDGYPSKLSCVDNINLPTSNALIMAISETCDWKNTFLDIKIMEMNTCINSNTQETMYTCTDTVLTQSTYAPGSSCSGKPLGSTQTHLIGYCNDITGMNTTKICL